LGEEALFNAVEFALAFDNDFMLLGFLCPDSESLMLFEFGTDSLRLDCMWFLLKLLVFGFATENFSI
jgi:hypothetical protein